MLWQKASPKVGLWLVPTVRRAAAAGLGGSSVLVTARSLERTRPSMSMPNGMWATTLAGPTISVLESTGNSKSKKAERRGVPPFCFFQRREEGKLFFCKKYFKKGVAFYFIFAIIMTVLPGWCNGSTGDSGSSCLGSSPSPGAIWKLSCHFSGSFFVTKNHT